MISMNLNSISSFILLLIVLISFFLLGITRLNVGIRMVAIQGCLTGCLAISSLSEHFSIHIVVTGLLTILLKGFILPHFLFRATQESRTGREMKPIIGPNPSMMIGVLLFAGSMWFGSKLTELSPYHFLTLSIACFVCLTGLFLIVARTLAVTQVIGYLVLENGIYLLSFVLLYGYNVPFLMELGTLLDLFVAIFVMGIAILHINREFDHIDATRLTSLKG